MSAQQQVGAEEAMSRLQVVRQQVGPTRRTARRGPVDVDDAERMLRELEHRVMLIQGGQR